MARFLVTGGAGFIGSHLVDALLSLGHDVTALDSLATGRRENLVPASNRPGFRFLQASVLDELAVDEAVRQSDIVVHLAAAVGVKLIVERPLHSLTTNIKGAVAILDAAHRYRRKVLVTSTSEIYGKNSADKLREDSDRILGSPAVSRWAYSTSKAVDEILAYAYHRELGLPTIVVRLFNTVGSRQSASYGMVIPRLVRQALVGEPLTVYGTGQQTRCFCHVDDAVDGIVRLLHEPLAEGDVFNIGGHEEISIEALAELIIERTNSKSTIARIPYEVAYETGFEDMLRRVPDTEKIFTLVGWRPTKTLTDILDAVISEVAAEGATSAITD